VDIYDRDAELYDIAFSWDVGEEVDWLLERLGGDVAAVLEPACGSGRMFPELVRRGVSVFGVDLSPEMLERAARRMADAGLRAETVCADIAEFDLGGRRFDGAIMPINTFGYLLTRDAALAHFACVARHLRPGGRYLIQVDLASYDDYRPADDDAASRWEMEDDGVRVLTTVTPGELDRATRTIVDHYCFEVLSGPDAGHVVEEHHPMRLWDWAGWSELIAASPFEQTGAYDGNQVPARPPLPVDQSLERDRLTWHELTRR
jgi:SAM-dependent methyltransferase